MILFWRPRQTVFKWRNFLFLFLLPSFLAGALLEDEKNNIEIYKKCGPATVNITSTTLAWDFFFEVQPRKGVGSGFIISSDGYVVTSDHVIGESVKVEVTLQDKSEYPAKVVGRDPASDLAVLKIEPKNKKLSSLEYGNPEELQVGQKVLAIGNPFKFGGSLSTGIISALGRTIRSDGGRTGKGRLIKDVIQTDAAINPGNSGGPLLDRDGKLIGINTQIVSTSGSSAGIGFATSVRTVKKIVTQLIRFGEVLRPTLGVETMGFSEGLLQLLRVPSKNGAMVVRVEANGPAAKAGMRPYQEVRRYGFQEIPVGGDVIFKIDNAPIETQEDIEDYIFEKEVGDKVTVYYYRNGKEKKATVRLEPPTGSKAKSF